MYEDKTLVCKDCGKEFVWTAGEQEFYQAVVSRTSPSAARHAAMPARTLPVVSARCSTPFAQAAARPARCPSSRAKTVRSTAASASLR